jgi:hypothetical protein
MNVYTDHKLLDIHGALDSLPSLERPAELAQATGTNGDRLVPLNVPPSHSRSRTIQVDLDGLGDLASDAKKQEKPRENIAFPGLYEVDPIGIEPTTSTLPVKGTCLSQRFFVDF